MRQQLQRKLQFQVQHASDSFLRQGSNSQSIRSGCIEISQRLALSTSRTDFISSLRPLAGRAPNPVKWTWWTPNEDHVGYHQEDAEREIGMQSVRVHRAYKPATTHAFSQEICPPVGHVIVVSLCGRITIYSFEELT